MGFAPSRDDNTWIGPATWAAITTVLIVITLTFDPLWSYYGSWAAGFMTAISAIGRKISQYKRLGLDSEDEALLLEVREAKGAEGDGGLGSEVNPEREKP